MSHRYWPFVVAAISSIGFPHTAAATVIWRGDWETGDRSQWSQTEMVSPDRLQVVPSPVRQGQYSLRAEVIQGDNPINASGNRNELVKYDGSVEGAEYYYGWSVLWPSDYPLTPTWQVFTQWHHPGCCGAPPVRFVLGCSAADCGQPLTDQLFLIVDNQQVWTYGPLTLGVWHSFILHVKWSATPTTGFVELWYDGQLVVPKRFIRTMFNATDTDYMKMGLYRDAATQPTAVLFHDGLVQATTFAEVEQTGQGTVDAGISVPGAGTGSGDSGVGVPDAGGGSGWHDAGSGVPDAGGGSGWHDAGSSVPDGGTGSGWHDAGSGAADSGTGVGYLDAGSGGGQPDYGPDGPRVDLGNVADPPGPVDTQPAGDATVDGMVTGGCSAMPSAVAPWTLLLAMAASRRLRARRRAD